MRPEEINQEEDTERLDASETQRFRSLAATLINGTDDDQRHGMINGTVVKHWSRTQGTLALSTAETEYYAVVTGAAEGLGMQLMMADLGLSAQVRV